MAFFSYTALIVAWLLFSCGERPAIATQEVVNPPLDLDIQLTYVGNMGVMVSSDKVAVVIDGLHTFYRDAYLPPPDSIVTAMLTKQGRYVNVRIALFTHHHRDHFSSMLSRKFLEASAQNKVAGSSQIMDSLAPTTPAMINSWNRNGMILQDTGIIINAFNIPHTGSKGRHASVQNIAYVLEMNGNKILHTGDAETDAAAFAQFTNSKPDIAIVPLWFLQGEDGKRIIASIAPRIVVATHIEPGGSFDFNALHLKSIPTYFFTRPGQVMP